MIHYQLIGAVREPYIEKNKVELKKERLEVPIWHKPYLTIDEATAYPALAEKNFVK